MFDIEKFAEESAIQAVKIGEMQKLIKYAADPPKEPEKIRVLTRAVPWQRIGTGAAIGAGAGGILSVLRDLLTGKSVSARRAIITSLLGGVAGGAIPYGVHALDPSRDRFQETLDDLTGKSKKPKEDTPLSEPEVEKLRVDIRKSLEDRVEKLGTLPPDSPEAKRIRKENDRLEHLLNTLKDVKNPWERSQIIRSAATILGGEIAIKSFQTFAGPYTTQRLADWIETPKPGSKDRSLAVLKHVALKIPNTPPEILASMAKLQSGKKLTIAESDMLDNHIETFRPANKTGKKGKKTPKWNSAAPLKTRLQKFLGLQDQRPVQAAVNSVIRVDEQSHNLARAQINKPTNTGGKPSRKVRKQRKADARTKLVQEEKALGFNPEGLKHSAPLKAVSAKALRTAGRWLPHALLFGYEGLRNYNRVTALEESNKARLNEVGSAIK